jgi:hypothetical protein
MCSIPSRTEPRAQTAERWPRAGRTTRGPRCDAGARGCLDSFTRSSGGRAAAAPATTKPARHRMPAVQPQKRCQLGQQEHQDDDQDERADSDADLHETSPLWLYCCNAAWRPKFVGGRFAGTLEGSPDGLALKPRFETHFQLAPKLGLRQGCPTYSGALAAELAHTAALDGRRVSGSGSPGHD